MSFVKLCSRLICYKFGCYPKSHLNAKTFQMFFSCSLTLTFLSENCAKSFDTGFNDSYMEANIIKKDNS